MITAIYIGKDRLSLFADENIRVTSNVTKISDITKIFTDTSNPFTVPANENNNRIFNHWYDANVINGFDARKKVPAIIELGGINYKVGKIRLNKVNLKSNKASNYSIEFFGNLVELKDLLGDDKLVDLDLSSLDFPYNFTEVKNKLENVQDVSFSLLSKRRLFYKDVGTVLDTEIQTNINDQGLLIKDLTPSIRQLKIIEGIEQKYNINFSRDFFGNYDFSNQFLISNNENNSSNYIIPLSFVLGGNNDPTRINNELFVNGDILFENSITEYISFNFTPSIGYRDILFSMYIINNGNVIAKREDVTGNDAISVGGTNTLQVFKKDVNLFENVYFTVKTKQPINYQSFVTRRLVNNVLYQHSNFNIFTFNLFLAGKSLPDVKIIDYLSGLFRMFKLVAIPQKDDTILVESLEQYYRKGKVYELTKYIDYESHTVSQGTLLNEISYKFEDPQTILNQQFKKLNGKGYGDLQAFINADGSKLEYKLPFEQVVYERISGTDLQYGLLLDENLEEVTVKPHIHYIENRTQTIKLVDDNQVPQNINKVNVPSHILNFALQTYSTTFEQEFSTYDGVIIQNTLFSNYHSSYISRIFNPQKREYNFKAIEVPTYIVLNLNLNDVIKIKENYYRIESIETNTLNNNVNLKLINDNVIDLKPLIPLSSDSTIITADNIFYTIDQTQTTQITNGTGIS